MQRAKQIFLQAIELPAAERAAFALRECAGDAELHIQVAALLEAHAGADSFLEKPAAALGQTIDSSPCRDADDEQPGVRIGPYKLLERIGEGGMGSVWMAEQQQPVRRLVALKLIKTGLDSRAVLARFEAERQALALMDHPNIAKVLDAGSADGRPYFVMELVKGTPITAFCDERRLPTRERLGLFVQVCHAIQHAHQKGVIHRDIKPTNVLVALYDDRPVPKVIDFGVAKAAGQPLTERTLHTGFGAIIGTPEYMSPEQAMFNQLDVDTRSDVYSLGVLLYELLTGTTPVDKAQYQKVAVLEVLRVVREDEPPRPSIKLSTATARASIAACRGSEPSRLANEMRGELDWIVMKSLEKDRNRRYETASGLAKDVERFLADEIVEARPPSIGYRISKFCWKHRGAVIGGAAGCVMLLVWFAFMMLFWHQARRAEQEAQAARVEAEQRRGEAVSQRIEAVDQRNKAITNEKKAQSELIRNEGLRLVLQSELVRPNDPGLALAIAIEGAARHPGLLANNALLAALAINCEKFTLLGHTGPVAGLCYNKDGSRLVTASLDGSARLWDTATGKQLMVFDDNLTLVLKDKTESKFKPMYTAVSFSPDGTRILTTSPHGRFRLWDISTGKCLFSLEAPEDQVGAQGPRFHPICPATFSPDGRWILTGYGTARLYDAATGQPRLALERLDDRVNWAEFNHNGGRIITASRNHAARIWDAQTGESIQTLKGPAPREMVMARMSPDGTRAVTVADTGGFITKEPLCRLWDIASGTEIATVGNSMGMGEFPPMARFTADGKLLTQERWSTGDLCLWDAATGKLLATSPYGKDYVVADWSPDGLHLATAPISTIDLRRMDTLTPYANLRGTKGKIQAVAYSPDGQHLASSDGTGAVRIWTVGAAAQRRLGRWPATGDDWQGFLAVSPDGRHVAGKTPDAAEVGIWDLTTGKQHARIKGKNLSGVTYAKFSGDGQRIAFGKRSYTKDSLCVGKVETGTLVAALPGDSYFDDFELSGDGSRLVTSQMRANRVWDVAANRELFSDKLSEGDWMIGGVSFSPDGTLLLTGEATGTRLRDAASGAELARLKPDLKSKLGFVAKSGLFSPDGRRALTWYNQCFEGFLGNLWDPRTHQPTATLRRDPADQGTVTITGAEFSRDGEWILAGCSDYSLRLFDAASGKTLLVLKDAENIRGSAALSPDKTRIVAAGDKTVSLWDARTGELLAVDRGYQEHIPFVRFLPEGRILAVDAKGSARVFPMDPLASARARAPRALTVDERRQHEVAK